MGLFWNRPKPTPPPLVAELESEIAALKARMVRAEQTVSELAERAYKYLKKAEARARRELDEPNQEPAPGTAPDPRATPVASSSPVRGQWGARARRGLFRAARPDPALDLNGTED